MPEILRQPIRLDCAGIDLVHPLDRMPEAAYPYLVNARVIQEGRLESRPGYETFSNAGSGFHSIRRLNDEDESTAVSGYIYLLGGATDLYAGTESTLAIIDSGYSGDPLSLLTFRPDQSSESWMYVYDRLRMRKVSVDQIVRPIGVPPPGAVLSADYAVPGMVDIDTGQSATGWVASEAAAAPSATSRTSSSVTPTIGTILYNEGTSGWCIIRPTFSSGDWAWAGDRMKVIIGGSENVMVREIHPAIPSTTIDAISYDSGTSGPCSLTISGENVDGIDRNSIIQLGSEWVRVEAVVKSPDGSNYSIRCTTVSTHAAGEVITGAISWYAYTFNTHAAGEALSGNYIFVPVPVAAGATTVAIVSKLVSLNAASATSGVGRPISLSDDYLHFSFYANNPQNIIALKIRIDIDLGTTSLANAFTRNYLTWTITPDQINNSDQTTPPPLGVWTEIIVPLSAAERSGGDQTLTLANVKAIQVELDMTSDLCTFGFDWWYLFGTYGPEVPINSPTGLVYASRYREEDTGAASVPGPPMRYELFPLREGIVITPQSNQTNLTNGANQIDIYRQGGAIIENLTYVGTVPNAGSGTPNFLIDSLPDTSIAASPQADFTLLQPWPILDYPWTGTVDVVGTTVLRVTGTEFNMNLLSNQVILINGIAYQVYGQPTSADRLEIFKSTGGLSLTGATFEIPAPTIAAQPLPYAFMLEGPFLPVLFGLGDPKNPGTLYYTNPGNLDAASDKNTIEICPPGEPLITGDSWNGLVIVGSRENKFLSRYSYLGDQDPSATKFQFNRVPSLSGMWARWACCRGLDGIYSLGRDGIYKTTEQGDESVTDPRLYPLFPHDGEPARAVNGVAAVDMNNLTRLRLSAADEDIYFDYASVEE